jgi:hypothetical protein
MKSKLVVLFLVLCSSSAFATVKECRYLGGSTGEGEPLMINVTPEQIEIRCSSTCAFAGTFPRGGMEQGRDGMDYLDYTIPSDEDAYWVGVNSNLLHEGGEGLIRFRARGESFSEDRYLCRDAE